MEAKGIVSFPLNIIFQIIFLVLQQKNLIKEINHCFYWFLNHTKNFSKETDCIEIGIELCSIPHISEHCPKKVPSLFM